MRLNMHIERVKNGYTIKEVGKLIGAHPNAVSRWESGTTEPTANNLIALCKLYGCSPEYLLDMTDDKHASAVAN